MVDNISIERYNNKTLTYVDNISKGSVNKELTESL